MHWGKRTDRGKSSPLAIRAPVEIGLRGQDCRCPAHHVRTTRYPRPRISRTIGNNARTRAHQAPDLNPRQFDDMASRIREGYPQAHFLADTFDAIPLCYSFAGSFVSDV